MGAKQGSRKRRQTRSPSTSSKRLKSSRLENTPSPVTRATTKALKERDLGIMDARNSIAPSVACELMESKDSAQQPVASIFSSILSADDLLSHAHGAHVWLWDDPSRVAEEPTFARPFTLITTNRRWTNELQFGVSTDTRWYVKRWLSFASKVGKTVWAMGAPRKFEELDVALQQRLNAFCPKASYYLDKGDDFSLKPFLQGFLHYLIWKHVFLPEGFEHWSCPEWRAFGQLRNSLRIHNTDKDNSWNVSFNSWRRHTARMLFTHYGLPISFEWMESMILKHFVPLFDNSKANPKGVALAISSAADAAVEIHFHMNCAEEVIEVTMGEPKTGKLHSFPYGPYVEVEEMEVTCHGFDRRDSSPLVDFVIQPLFRMYGKRTDQPEYLNGPLELVTDKGADKSVDRAADEAKTDAIAESADEVADKVNDKSTEDATAKVTGRVTYRMTVLDDPVNVMGPIGPHGCMGSFGTSEGSIRYRQYCIYRTAAAVFVPPKTELDAESN